MGCGCSVLWHTLHKIQFLDVAAGFPTLHLPDQTSQLSMDIHLSAVLKPVDIFSTVTSHEVLDIHAEAAVPKPGGAWDQYAAGRPRIQTVLKIFAFR